MPYSEIIGYGCISTTPVSLDDANRDWIIWIIINIITSGKYDFNKTNNIIQEIIILQKVGYSKYLFLERKTRSSMSSIMNNINIIAKKKME